MKTQSNSRTKKAIKLTQDICAAAHIYQKSLVGNTFLYVFEGRFVEVTYRIRDFLHLTGVDTRIGAVDFYKNALNGLLMHRQIFFNQRHQYHLSAKKVQRLLSIDKIISKDLFLLEDVSTDTASYSFGIMDLDFTVCVNQIFHADGSLKSEYYIPMSLRVEDSFHRASNIYEVNLILKKRNDQQLYSEITYMDNKQQIPALPPDIMSKIDVPYIMGLLGTPQEKNSKDNKAV